MENKEIIESISAKQRQDMLSKGLSPLNPNHIRKYLQEGGRVKASPQQMLERAKVLIGEENLHSLGSSHEKEISFNPKTGKGLAGYDPEEIITQTSATKNFNSKNTREELLGDYGVSNGLTSSSELLSLKEDFGNGVPKRTNQNIDKVKYEELGYKTTIKYLNTMIINLKNPSTQNRLNLFNALKTVLQGENNLKTNASAVQAYRNGCVRAEQSMYTKLTQ